MRRTASVVPYLALLAALLFPATAPLADPPDLEQGERARIETLIERLGGDVWQERDEADRALREIGERAAPLLAEHLESDNPEVRNRIRQILIDTGGWRHVPSMAGVMLRSKIDTVLGIGNPASLVPELDPGVENSRSMIRARMIRARMTRAISRDRGEDSELQKRQAALEELVSFVREGGEPLVPDLLDGVRRAGPDTPGRALHLYLLGIAGSPAASPGIREALETPGTGADGETIDRIGIAALGAIADPESAGFLIDRIRSTPAAPPASLWSGIDTRTLCLWALNRCGGEAADAFFDAALDSRDPVERLFGAIRILRTTGSPGGYNPYIEKGTRDAAAARIRGSAPAARPPSLHRPLYYAAIRNLPGLRERIRALPAWERRPGLREHFERTVVGGMTEAWQAISGMGGTETPLPTTERTIDLLAGAEGIEFALTDLVPETVTVTEHGIGYEYTRTRLRPKMLLSARFADGETLRSLFDNPLWRAFGITREGEGTDAVLFVPGEMAGIDPAIGDGLRIARRGSTLLVSNDTPLLAEARSLPDAPLAASLDLPGVHEDAFFVQSADSWPLISLLVEAENVRRQGPAGDLMGYRMLFSMDAMCDFQHLGRAVSWVRWDEEDRIEIAADVAVSEHSMLYRWIRAEPRPLGMMDLLPTDTLIAGGITGPDMTEVWPPFRERLAIVTRDGFGEDFVSSGEMDEEFRQFTGSTSDAFITSLGNEAGFCLTPNAGGGIADVNFFLCFGGRSEEALETILGNIRAIGRQTPRTHRETEILGGDDPEWAGVGGLLLMADDGRTRDTPPIHFAIDALADPEKRLTWDDSTLSLEGVNGFLVMNLDAILRLGGREGVTIAEAVGTAEAPYLRAAIRTLPDRIEGRAQLDLPLSTLLPRVVSLVPGAPGEAGEHVRESYRASNRTANHRSAVNTLMVIAMAQMEHKNNTGTYADLDNLMTPDGHFRVPRLDDGEGTVTHGYVFQSLGVPDAFTWAAEAVPQAYGVSGTNTYIVNQDGIVWMMDTAGASAGAFPADPAAAGWIRVE